MSPGKKKKQIPQLQWIFEHEKNINHKKATNNVTVKSKKQQQQIYTYLEPKWGPNAVFVGKFLGAWEIGGFYFSPTNRGLTVTGSRGPAYPRQNL